MHNKIKNNIDRIFLFQKEYKYSNYIIDIESLVNSYKEKTIHILGSGESMPDTYSKYYKKGDITIGFNFSTLSPFKVDMQFVELYSSYKKFIKLSNIQFQSISINTNKFDKILLNNTSAWYNNNLDPYVNNQSINNILILKHKFQRKLDDNLFLKRIHNNQIYKYKATVIFLASIFSSDKNEILLHGCNGKGGFFYEDQSYLDDGMGELAEKLINHRAKVENSNKHVLSSYHNILSILDRVSDLSCGNVRVL
jgi:hypothetical protein